MNKYICMCVFTVTLLLVGCDSANDITQETVISSQVITETPLGGAFLPLSSANIAVQTDYDNYSLKENIGSENLYYFLVVDENETPIPNLRCYNLYDWENYLATETAHFSGLSMHSGLMPVHIFNTENEVKMIIANTDVNGEPIFEEIILSAEQLSRIEEGNILKIYWNHPVPNETVLSCDKTITLSAYQDRDKTEGATFTLLSVDLHTDLHLYMGNPALGEYTPEPEYLARELIELPQSTVADIGNGMVDFPPYKAIFDPRYTDENGMVTFKVNYLPNHISVNKKIYETKAPEEIGSTTFQVYNQLRIFPCNTAYFGKTHDFSRMPLHLHYDTDIIGEQYNIELEVVI